MKKIHHMFCQKAIDFMQENVHLKKVLLVGNKLLSLHENAGQAWRKLIMLTSACEASLFKRKKLWQLDLYIVETIILLLT